jgi:hypothetical protein
MSSSRISQICGSDLRRVLALRHLPSAQEASRRLRVAAVPQASLAFYSDVVREHFGLGSDRKPCYAAPVLARRPQMLYPDAMPVSKVVSPG